MNLRHLRQRGVTLVTAIFLLVVLGSLGLAMVSLSTSQQKSSSLDVTGVHAYLAAKSGVEWGLYRALVDLQCSGATTRFVVDINISATYYVDVLCESVTQLGIVRRRVTATACNRAANCSNAPTAPNGPDYVHRVVSAEF